MDVGNKTLSQLSEEAKEKRYVTLDTAAKVSGYTKEYLERLCRLNKVEYRFWNKSEFVIELESLLAETHTILLSYDDISFAEKERLEPEETLVETAEGGDSHGVVQSKQAAASEAGRMFSEKLAKGITQVVPSYGARSASQNPDSPYAVVGHAVISNPLEKSNVAEAPTSEAPQVQPQNIIVDSTPLPTIPVESPKVEETKEMPKAEEQKVTEEKIEESPKEKIEVKIEVKIEEKAVEIKEEKIEAKAEEKTEEKSKEVEIKVAEEIKKAEEKREIKGTEEIVETKEATNETIETKEIKEAQEAKETQETKETKPEVVIVPLVVVTQSPTEHDEPPRTQPVVYSPVVETPIVAATVVESVPPPSPLHASLPPLPPPPLPPPKNLHVANSHFAIPVTKDNDSISSQNDSVALHSISPLHELKNAVHITVTGEKKAESPVEDEHNEWNALRVQLKPHVSTLEVPADGSLHTPPKEESHATGILSPYHAIETSLDAKEHHDPAPLFPLIGQLITSSFGVEKKVSDGEHSDETPEEIRHGIPQLGDDKRVVVFLPEKFPLSMSSHTEVAAPTPDIVSPTLAVSLPSMAALAKVQAILPGDPQKGTIMRAMPHELKAAEKALPSLLPERHLMIREKHPLVKSIGFNVAIASFLIGATLLTLGSRIVSLPFPLDPSRVIAGIGAVIFPRIQMVIPAFPESEPPAGTQSSVLPFSDQIVVASGTDDTSIVVEPIFRSTSGVKKEYHIATSTLK